MTAPISQNDVQELFSPSDFLGANILGKPMVWSYNENWMVIGDDGGSIKYWQNNMNNVKVNKSAHKESICELRLCWQKLLQLSAKPNSSTFQHHQLSANGEVIRKNW